MKQLALAVKQGKLPRLEKLILESNKLSDHYNDLLGGTEHPGFQSLKELYLRDTNPSKADMAHLTKAVKDGKFDKLKCLDVRSNSLGERDVDEVGPFARSCVDTYRGEFVLRMETNYGLDKSLREKIKKLNEC